MPSSNRTTSPYQRFIPSEEVQAVSAWEFAPMGGSATAAAESVPEPEEAAPPDPAPEEVKQAAYDQGFDDGKRAGAEETRQALEPLLHKEVRELTQRVERLLAQAQTDLSRLEDGLAAQVLELACDLARQVVRCELAASQAPLRAVVQEALALAVEAGQPATLRLHPQDLASLSAGRSEPDPSVKWVADASLTPGGCVVESAHGTVDASLEKRWARAVANLGVQLPWQVPTMPARPTEAPDA